MESLRRFHENLTDRRCKYEFMDLQQESYYISARIYDILGLKTERNENSRKFNHIIELQKKRDSSTSHLHHIDENLLMHELKSLLINSD